MEWERIDINMYRARIPGGWLVKHEAPVIHDTSHLGMIDGWDERISICFVPDPDHTWIVFRS